MNFLILILFSTIISEAFAVQDYKFLRLECKEFNNVTTTDSCEVDNKRLFFKITTLRSIKQMFVSFRIAKIIRTNFKNIVNPLSSTLSYWRRKMDNLCNFSHFQSIGVDSTQKQLKGRCFKSFFSKLSKMRRIFLRLALSMAPIKRWT